MKYEILFQRDGESVSTKEVDAIDKTDAARKCGIDQSFIISISPLNEDSKKNFIKVIVIKSMATYFPIMNGLPGHWGN